MRPGTLPIGTWPLWQQLERLPMWLPVAVFGVLIPALLYGLAPLAGIDTFQNMLSLKKLAALIFLGAMGLVYIRYFRRVTERPYLLAGYYLWAWPLAEYLNNVLLIFGGVNLRFRPLMLVAVAFPAIWLTVRYVRPLFRNLPYFKYYLLFLAIITGYFLFYNDMAMTASTTGSDGLFGESSISFTQLLSYLYCFLGIVVAGTAMYKADNHREVFDRLNTGLLVITGLMALASIIGYPFNWFSDNIDGFRRSIGFFTHPNPYAHHMGILMLYLIGIFIYYQGYKTRPRIPTWLFIASIGLNTMGLLLALSKTALFMFSCCITIFFLLNITTPRIRKTLFKAILVGVVLAPIAFFVYQLVTGQNFFDLLEARVSKKESLDWRVEIWNYVINQIDVKTLLMGNGYTSANNLVLGLTYNDRTNSVPVILIHNGYVSLLYDIGLLGYLVFWSALSMALHSLRKAIQPAWLEYKPLFSTIIVMALYFLAVCYFDEMVYMFDAPQFFWTLATLLFGYSLRERRQWEG